MILTITPYLHRFLPIGSAKIFSIEVGLTEDYFKPETVSGSRYAEFDPDPGAEVVEVVRLRLLN